MINEVHAILTSMAYKPFKSTILKYAKNDEKDDRCAVSYNKML